MDVFSAPPTIAISSRLSPSELQPQAEVDPREGYSELNMGLKKQQSLTIVDTHRINCPALTNKEEALVPRIQASSQLDDRATNLTASYNPTSTSLLPTLPSVPSASASAMASASSTMSISSPTLEGQLPPTELTLDSSTPKQQELSLNRENDITSAISVLSTSGTLVSSNPVQPAMLLAPAHATFSSTTTTHTINSAPPPAPVPVCFDRQSFKIVFQDLVNQTEQFETLNDQVLDAMTEFDETRLGLRPATLSGTGWSSDSDNLEEARHRIAKAVTDQVLSAWPSLSISAPWSSTTTSGYSSEKNAGEHQQQQQGQERAAAAHDAKLLKLRIKAVNQLKNATVAFWSAQNHFHERAQLVLDIFQVTCLSDFNLLLPRLRYHDSLTMVHCMHLNRLKKKCVGPD